jgi:hypothetical protein
VGFGTQCCPLQQDTTDLGKGFTDVCGRFGRDNVLLDTNQAPVYAGMTCRKGKGQIGRLEKSGKDALHWRSFSTALGKAMEGHRRWLSGAARRGVHLIFRSKSVRVERRRVGH